MRVPLVLGVDGCPGGWICAIVGAGPAPSWRLVHDASGVLAAAAQLGAEAVGVDIPIGLAEDDSRAADRTARAVLGVRRSSVFPAPVRAVLDATSYAEACRLSRLATGGTAISRQTWGVVPRIRDWDRLVTSALQQQVVEVHPEVSFVQLTRAGVRADPGRPGPPPAPLPAKRTLAGRAARTALLTAWLPALPQALARPVRPAPVEDCLDALACAWSARRWARGEALLLPVDPPTDSRGRWVEIVC